MSRVENEHPVVIRHPVTQRATLFLCNWPCKRFAGMTMEESKPLKNWLMKRAVAPENVYRHEWKVGDFVMIDNRCTMHNAIRNYDTSQLNSRVLHRTTITDVGDA